MANFGCSVCPIEGGRNLMQLADRIERVYASQACIEAEDDIEDDVRRHEITPATIDDLNTELLDDIKLSLASCFTRLRETAGQDQETLQTLVDEQKIAVAGCASHRLQGSCSF